MAKYIHSTCSADIEFPMYIKTGPKSLSANATKTIVIRGGANVRDRNSLATPTGMVTEVSDEELAFLQNDPLFKDEVAKGHMKVMDKEKLDVSDMSPKDHAAQILDADHAAVSETTATAGFHDKWKGAKGANFNA